MLIPLLAGGCFEVDDLGSVEAADASDDAAIKADAGQPFFDDAGSVGGDDASVADAQATAPCSATSCGEAQVCAPNGSCIARCDSSGVCVVASTTRIVTALMADGPMLYVGLAATKDRFGNLAPDAELRTQVGDGELTLLTTLPENAERIESHGEHVYWTGTRPDTTSKKLRRVSKRAVSGPEALYASANLAGNVLLTDTRVALRQTDGIYVGSLDGATELRKVQDCPAVTQAWDDVCYPMALRGDALFYLRPGAPTANDPNPVVVSSVDLVTMERKDYGPGYHNTSFLAVEPPYLYFPYSTGASAQMLYRRDLRDLTIPDFTLWLGNSPYYTYASGQAIRLRGDWVYVLAAESNFGNGVSNKRMVFERAAATGPVNVQSILPDTFGNPTTDQYVDYTLTDTHAFVALLQTSPTGVLGSLVYRVPLPR